MLFIFFKMFAKQKVSIQRKMSGQHVLSTHYETTKLANAIKRAILRCRHYALGLNFHFKIPTIFLEISVK